MLNVHNELVDLLAGHCLLNMESGDCPADETIECGDCLVNYLMAHGVTIQRWIPVTEEVPHFSPGKWRKVLVTMEDEQGHRFTTTAKYDEKHGEWYKFTRWKYTKYKVLAWMPKPERYNPPEVAGNG